MKVRSALRMYSSCTSWAKAAAAAAMALAMLTRMRPSIVAGISLGQEQAGVAPVLDEGDHLAVPRLAQHDGLAPLAQVVADDRVVLVHARRR